MHLFLRPGDGDFFVVVDRGKFGRLECKNCCLTVKKVGSTNENVELSTENWHLRSKHGSFINTKRPPWIGKVLGVMVDNYWVYGGDQFIVGWVNQPTYTWTLVVWIKILRPSKWMVKEARVSAM